MIKRDSGRTLKRLARGFPIVAITGPRQSGKTTLARATFPKKPYLSLEDPDMRMMAEDDPRGLLSEFPDGVVLDEVQRTPGLFSYLQTIVDEDIRNEVMRCVLDALMVPPAIAESYWQLYQ